MAASGNIDSTVWLRHAWRNRIQSLVLLLVMAGFLVVLGWILWGPDGVLILLVVGIAGVVFNPALSPWLVMRMYGARSIDPHSAPELVAPTFKTFLLAA